MSDLPEIKIDKLIQAVNTAELIGPLKNFESLCIKVANGSWANCEDFDNEVIASLILHHNIPTKTLKPGETAPLNPVVVPIKDELGKSFATEIVAAQILAPVVVSQIKTYDTGGKGKKQCGQCRKYLGLRASICNCGYIFQKKGETVAAKVPVMTVAAEEYEPETHSDTESSQVSIGRRSSGGGIGTPSGSCPSSLTGTDLASVKRWAEAVRKNYSGKNQFLTVEGLRYFAREFYGIHSPEFQQVKLRLLELYGSED